MDPRLEEYIGQVRSILAAKPTPDQTVAQIEEAARELVSKPLEISDEFRRVPEEGYGRNLIYKDADHGFVVIAMAWPAGIQGAPHDHGTWGVVAVAEGNVVLVNYERTDDGSDPAVVQLEPRDRVEGKPGDVGHVLPPEVDFHTVGNACPESFALTIHTYGCDIQECNLLCPETGELKRVFPSYH